MASEPKKERGQDEHGLSAERTTERKRQILRTTPAVDFDLPITPQYLLWSGGYQW